MNISKLFLPIRLITTRKKFRNEFKFDPPPERSWRELEFCCMLYKILLKEGINERYLRSLFRTYLSSESVVEGVYQILHEVVSGRKGQSTLDQYFKD